jgi:hypothetical protein
MRNTLTQRRGAHDRLDEGDNLEKLVVTTSSSIYVPPGMAHFPQIWRNVRRPVMTVVIMPNAEKHRLKAAACQGEIFQDFRKICPMFRYRLR